MFKVFIIADESKHIRELGSELVQKGFACSIASSREKAVEQVTEQDPDLVLIAMDSFPAILMIRDLTQRIKQKRHLPVIALLSKEALGNLDSTPGIDDFVLEPWDATKVAVRAKRVLWRMNNIDSGELI